MTRYLLLNIIFLLAIALVCLHLKKKTSTALYVAVLVTVLLTVVFDNLIIKFGIVGYNLNHILGIYIFKAPIEDFAYAIGSVMFVGLLWEYYESKK